jgi:hypothetical protein
MSFGGIKKREETRSVLPEKTSRETMSDNRRRHRFFVGVWCTSRQILGEPFGWRSLATLRLRQVTFLEENCHNIIVDDIKLYFDCVKHHLQTIPSVFIWTANEARVGSPKKQQVLVLIVSVSTGPGLITVPESRLDSQLTLLIAISRFTDSIPSLFLSKNKTSEKNRLAEEQQGEEDDYTIRTSLKPFSKEALFSY